MIFTNLSLNSISDEIFSVTTQMQQEEIEHVEEVEQQSQSDQIQSTTVCLDEATIIEQDEEEYEEEELEEEEEGVFTLELSEGSDCEDKEYLGTFILCSIGIISLVFAKACFFIKISYLFLCSRIC